MSANIWWYLARSAGMVAWLMLTASVLWGLALSTRSLPHRRPAWLLDLHRWLGGLTVAFVALHIAALVGDSFVPITLVDAVVPGTSAYRPLAVAWGVVAVWGLVAVQATSQARKRLPKRTWKVVHLTSYATFALATVHAFTAGTDAGLLLYRVTGALGAVAVVVATAWRIADTRRPPRRPPRPARPIGPSLDVRPTAPTALRCPPDVEAASSATTTGGSMTTIRRAIAPLGLIVALALGATACGSAGKDSTPSDAPSTTAGSSTTGGDSAAGATVSANDASQEEIAAALDAAGVDNADRWADEVVEYRPYDDVDQGFPHLREELQKYNPPEGTVDLIIAVLR